MRRFAPLYAELDRLEAQLARQAAELRPSSATLAAAEAAESLAQESGINASVAQMSAVSTSGSNPDGSAPDELKSIYREAAKLIHPDLATDPNEQARRTKLMAELNELFEQRDAGAIRRLVAAESMRPDAVVGEDTASRLVRCLRRIAQVRHRMAEIQHLRDVLMADPLHELWDAVRTQDEMGADPLAEDEASLRTRIATARARLAEAMQASGSSGREPTP